MQVVATPVVATTAAPVALVQAKGATMLEPATPRRPEAIRRMVTPATLGITPRRSITAVTTRKALAKGQPFASPSR